MLTRMLLRGAARCVSVICTGVVRDGDGYLSRGACAGASPGRLVRARALDALGAWAAAVVAMMRRRWCRGCTYGGCVREWYDIAAAAARLEVNARCDAATVCRWWSE